MLSGLGGSALIGAWLAGFLGGVHCLAMCGGFLAALSGAGAAGRAVPMLPARTLALRQLPYNLGRVTTYMVMGAILGAAGSATLFGVQWLPVQRGLFVAANGFLLLLGIGIAWPRDPAGSLQRIGAGLFTRLAPVLRRLATRDAAWARFGVGLLWGFIPCGLVYGVVPIALFAGGGIEGGAVMLAFGLGTLPNLVAAGWLLARFRPWVARPVVRYAAAVLLCGFALLGIWRALFGPMAAGQGPFCLTP